MSRFLFTFRRLSKTWLPQIKFEAHHGSGGLDLVEHLLLADLDRQQAGVEEAEEAAERLEPCVWQEKTWRKVGRAGGEQLGQARREQGEDALVGGQALALPRHEEHVGVVGGLLAQRCLQVLAELRQDLRRPLDLGTLDFGHHMLHCCKSAEH